MLTSLWQVFFDYNYFKRLNLALKFTCCVAVASRSSWAWWFLEYRYFTR